MTRSWARQQKELCFKVRVKVRVTGLHKLVGKKNLILDISTTVVKPYIRAVCDVVFWGISVRVNFLQDKGQRNFF